MGAPKENEEILMVGMLSDEDSQARAAAEIVASQSGDPETEYDKLIYGSFALGITATAMLVAHNRLRKGDKR